MSVDIKPPAPVLIAAAASALKQRIEEVNRLNVFPVPDGDTGTNMSLTMQAVVTEVEKLGASPALADVLHAVTHGSLMGARGNSGVILSQILRGLCEGIDAPERLDSNVVARALERATEVAMQAVRKPVEGTMLTVIREVAEAARAACDGDCDSSDTLERITTAAFDSVNRTPELLPVLKENGVVDAGGFGLAILIEGFVGAALGRAVAVSQVSTVAPGASAEPSDDWDDDEFLYCTEFLLFGPDIDRDALHDHVAAAGGSELVVGEAGEYKVHVHTDDPGSVLAYVTSLGEVAEVHINNMRRQTEARGEGLRASGVPEASAVPPKPVGYVAVTAGKGLEAILRSLGVDVIVSGGQTMNPSTADLLAAIDSVNADAVVVLPNNKNIIMAANAAVSVSSKPVRVVPTRSVGQAFAALLAADADGDLDTLATAMGEAAEAVHTAEVTTAVKDAKGKIGDIAAGQVIGIVDDEDIEAVGHDVLGVAKDLIGILAKRDVETITLFAGTDLDDADFARITDSLSADYPDLEFEAHRGDQPLYPLIISAE